MEQHRIIESTLRDSVVDAIRSMLETNISILSAIAGFFNGATTVSRAEFRTFHESVALNTGQLKGVQGVGFARSIPASELSAYEAAICQQGFNGFRVRPEGERPTYSATRPPTMRSRAWPTARCWWIALNRIWPWPSAINTEWACCSWISTDSRP
ncbi:MAG: CHASE domain-containing protein [Vulcanococcus sp.]